MGTGVRGGHEKAAIVLLALGNELGAKVLQRFKSTEVKHIMESAASIGTVDKDDLDNLVDEFAAKFAKSLGLDTGIDNVKSLVEQAFPPGELDSMLGAGALPANQPVWMKFGAGSENALVPYLLDEHPQTIAFIVSQLEPGLAARCLALLPGDMRNAAAIRLLKIQTIAPDIRKIVELRVECDLLVKSDAKIEEEGRDRLAALLNKLDRQQTDAIFENLSNVKPEEAKRLRSKVFSFEDLPKLGQTARLALFDKLQTDQVVMALRGATPELKELALSSLGARARRMVEAELANDNGQVTAQTEAARNAISETVLAMAARGELSLTED